MQLRGQKLPNSVIGRRNCGLPSLEDCMGKRHTLTKLPLQSKRLRPAITAREIDKSLDKFEIAIMPIHVRFHWTTA